MTNQPSDPVTPPANPSDEQQIPAAQGASTPVESIAPEATQPPTTEPDAAYKGIQRRLAREQDRVRELEQRLAQANTGGGDEQAFAVIGALIGEIEKIDPAKGAALKSEFATARIVAENQQYRTREAQEEAQRQAQQTEERILGELRATAAAFGANPASPLTDYGDPAEDFATRLGRVRADAQKAAAPATPVTPPVRSSTDGTGHNTQPGTPMTPNQQAREVTQEDVMRLQVAYAHAMQTPNLEARQKAEAELRAANDRYAAQVFAS